MKSSNKPLKEARQKRLAEQIYRLLRSQILYCSSNLLIKSTSIEKVLVNRDLSLATLYVRFLDDFVETKDQEENNLSIQEKIKTLNHNSGFFRSHLAKNLSIFKAPEIRFIYDDSIEKKMKIDLLIEKLNRQS